jgi:hypothetical protein
MRPGVSAPDTQYDVGISSVSDTYITELLLHFSDTHEKYMLQWSEQNVRRCHNVNRII